MQKEFWAKTEPFQSVTTHGIVSGHVCKFLMKSYLSKGSKILVAELLGLPARFGSKVKVFSENIMLDLLFIWLEGVSSGG